MADLFAGSGALGFEALSRGAASAVFVEQDAKVTAAIKRNAERLGAVDRIRILGGSALVLPRSEPFDLILADPPYSARLGNGSREGRRRRQLAGAGRMDERRNRPPGHGRSGSFTIDATRGVGRRGLRFCAGLRSFAALRISSISLLRRRPTAAAAAAPAAFTARPARLPVEPPPAPRLLKPCSASAASAAVAATATSSATKGLWSSLMKASPVLSEARRPRSPPRRSAAARGFEFLLAGLSLWCPTACSSLSSPFLSPALWLSRIQLIRRIPVSASTDLLY